MIGLQIPQFYVTLGYIEEWRTCATEPLTPVFTIVQYSALAITDIAVIILFIAAVLEIPYKDSAEVIVKLEKDGGWYFVSLFVIHLGCILVLATGKVGTQ
ncbi:hypothetical protein AN958_12201 [Leucoagaricus sp. SymC.cos]|nr:hypothetical protein AN958_12201 [Leucoagaricus sp. SymC.cos]